MLREWMLSSRLFSKHCEYFRLLHDFNLLESLLHIIQMELFVKSVKVYSIYTNQLQLLFNSLCISGLVASSPSDLEMIKDVLVVNDHSELAFTTEVNCYSDFKGIDKKGPCTPS